MPKTLLNPDQILRLTNLVNEIPDLVKRLKKDGEQIKAFIDDAQDAVNLAKTDEEKMLIFSSVTLVMLKFKDCARKWSFDPFKPARLKADDIARLLSFERYKKLRNIK